MDPKHLEKIKKAGFRAGLKGAENPLSKIRGMRTNVRVFGNAKERRLAALHIYYDRMHGATLEELSRAYKLSETTISRLLKIAMADDLVKKLEDQILNDVVPLAIQVYKKKLAEDSEFVAKDVLANFAKIADRSIKRQELEKSQEQDEDSLEFLLRIKGKKNFKPELPEEVIDGTIVKSEPGISGELTEGSGDSLWIPPAVEESIQEAVRNDLQPVKGVEEGGTSELSKGGPKGGFPGRIRASRPQESNFISIRELLKTEMLKEAENG